MTECILMNPKQTNTISDYKVTRGSRAFSVLHSCRATAYLEYLIAAAAMATAAIWLWQDGNLQGARQAMQDKYNVQRDAIVN